MLYLALAALALPGPVQSFQARHDASAIAPLLYVEISAALGGPALDGGGTELEMDDVNGDGHVDVVSVGDHGSPYVGTQEHGVMVWLGDGSGNFSFVANGDFGYGGVALGDVNGDGRCDVGYGVHHDYSSTDFGDQLLEVALGDGTGSGWTPWDDGLATSGETWGMFATDFGDVDADGDLDIVSNSFGCCAGVHCYLNNGDGTWKQSFGVLGGNSDHFLRLADVNGDGRLDIVAGYQDTRVFLGSGGGGFTDGDANLPEGYSGMSTADVDGDGDDEVAIVIGGGIQVWNWSQGIWVSDSVGLPPSGSFADLDLVDMDRDGIADVVALGNNGQLAVFRRPLGWKWWMPAFSAEVPGPSSKSSSALRAGGDLDHNGFPEICLWQEEGSGIWTSGANVFHCFAESTPATELDIVPAEPLPGRALRAGQATWVTWTSAAPGANKGTVSLYLSTTGPGGPYQVLALDVPNDGRQQVVLPVVRSQNCWVIYQVFAGGQFDVQMSRGAFRIVP